ncbi:Rhomboid-related intramembrane serine protease family protein [Striga hermonthica]|uniref:RHOMBOID-like protein n=1 Tax=Striga hermonthica TaxID=68872 RepID=A0A9N7MHM3_STRHE|nr:Rhomboid-related intramembrane serine protease family protein [Striga hermonthica]
MADAETLKPHTNIDIKSIQKIPADFASEEPFREQTVAFPFFRRLSQRKESTWIVSVFVILHLIAFCGAMIVNDCWGNSNAQCVFKQLGRFSFQPLSENPLLGPSASGLDAAGALRLRYLARDHQSWRVLSSSCLHAGVFHLVTSLTCVIFVGVHLEQEFGPLRIGIIYVLSALIGGLLAALFLQDRPSVSASGPLFGLLGATLSGLIQNWKVYSRKFASLVAFLIILMLNFMIGLMPLVNNFSNIGGFITGFLAGFMLLLKPQVGKVCPNKGGIFDYDVKKSVEIKRKLDKPVLRIICLVIFSFLVVGVVLGLLEGVNANKYCGWCKYIDCVPIKWWSCSDKTMNCETMRSSEQLTLTCSDNGKFRVFPFANVSSARLEDLCNLMCS